MTKRLLSIALTLIISISLIAAGTMAWFTGSADAGTAAFTAGTVKVNAEGAYVLGGKSLSNVNPGDCFVIQWKITNDGSKKIQLRTLLDFGWTNSELTGDNIYIIPVPVNDDYPYNWVLYQEDADEPLYAYLKGYPEGLLPGQDVELWLVVYFDGEMTDNPYQGEEFTLGGTVEAVQATNGAPSAVWGSSWDEINGDNYSFGYEFWNEYWQEFDPMNVKCYKHFVPTETEPTNPTETTNPTEQTPIAKSFTVNLNETKILKNGSAKVKFHIQHLVDENNENIDEEKDVYYEIYVNGSKVYQELIENVEFNGGGNSNNIEAFFTGGNKGDKVTVVVKIDDVVESKEKKLN